MPRLRRKLSQRRPLAASPSGLDVATLPSGFVKFSWLDIEGTFHGEIVNLKHYICHFLPGCDQTHIWSHLLKLPSKIANRSACCLYVSSVEIRTWNAEHMGTYGWGQTGSGAATNGNVWLLQRQCLAPSIEIVGAIRRNNIHTTLGDKHPFILENICRFC